VAFTGLALVAALAGMARGAAVVARHQVEAAADLAALAASGRAAHGFGDGCAVAGEVAAANGARLAECRLTGPLADVTAEKTLTAGRLGRHRVAARARADPAGQEPGDAVTDASEPPGPSTGR
jgi:secretion/DNA translocation related TadE-like protein